MGEGGCPLPPVRAAPCPGLSFPNVWKHIFHMTWVWLGPGSSTSFLTLPSLSHFLGPKGNSPSSCAPHTT